MSAKVHVEQIDLLAADVSSLPPHRPVRELKAILCSLFAHFEFKPAQEEPREDSAITMKPKGGLRMHIKRLSTL